MTACIVQQLFRQKIGKELDQYLIDDVLFPMLRPRKELSKELLLDIKLTQSSNEYGQSAILIYPKSNEDVGDIPAWSPQNISPFEEPLSPTSPWLPSRKQREIGNPGRINGSLRRLRHPSVWGTIDILNELRELKHPQIGYHPSYIQQDQLDYPGEEFDGAFLRLKEVSMRPRIAPEKIAIDLKFVNDYLEDALNTGKRLSWGGDPNVPNSFENILSTYW
jgi:hypothetical protein